MNKKLNTLIKRKNYQNFKNGVVNMNYRLSEREYEDVVKLIKDEEINERLVVLKNQVGFFNGELKKPIDNTTLSKDDAESINKNINSINDSLDVLNFKKQTLQVSLDEYLSNMNISEAIKLKSKLSEIEKQVSEFELKKKDLNNKIESSKLDYETQMIKIRDKYDNVDVLKEDFSDNDFSQNVIYDYKIERASHLVNQFLDSLDSDKKQQILEENENLKGLINVGENI